MRREPSARTVFNRALFYCTSCERILQTGRFSTATHLGIAVPRLLVAFPNSRCNRSHLSLIIIFMEGCPQPQEVAHNLTIAS